MFVFFGGEVGGEGGGVKLNDCKSVFDNAKSLRDFMWLSKLSERILGACFWIWRL